MHYFIVSDSVVTDFGESVTFSYHHNHHERDSQHDLCGVSIGTVTECLTVLLDFLENGFSSPHCQECAMLVLRNLCCHAVNKPKLLANGGGLCLYVSMCECVCLCVSVSVSV